MNIKFTSSYRGLPLSPAKQKEQEKKECLKRSKREIGHFRA